MQSCTQCGHSNPDEARFCSNCGAALQPGAPLSAGETSTITISGGIEPAEATDKLEGLSSGDQAAIDALPPGSALLVVRRGPNAGSRFLLDSEVTTAGRHPSSDISSTT
jgi:pSer/pThr/pTyr-binding forkhead associated (FHA) protein